jgi:hypothetical protein
MSTPARLKSHPQITGRRTFVSIHIDINEFSRHRDAAFVERAVGQIEADPAYEENGTDP